VSVDRDVGNERELSVVLVRGSASNAIVPSEPFGRFPALPGGSVSLAGIRRAASKVREEDGQRNLAAIAEATLGSEPIGCGPRGRGGNQ
jgi:hypothetical protein